MMLKTKIITIVALTIILTVGLATSVVLNLQNKQMVNDKLADTIFLADVIERTIDNDMKEANTKNVQKTLENIGKSKEILDIRILSPDGTILKSKNTAELGTKSQDYIQSSFGDSSHKPAIINKTTIKYTKNILNRKECYGCHSSKEPVIGIIQINVDINRSLLVMLSVKRLFIFSSILIVLIISVILSILFSYLVMKPLKNLLSTIHDVESGNWNAKVKIESSDELGIIGISFNKMIEEINKFYKKDIIKERELSKIKLELEHKNKVEELNTQLEFKIKELETANRAITSLSKEVKTKNIDLEQVVEQLKKINEISRILSSIIDPEELLKIITRTTAELLNAEKTILHVKKDEDAPTTLQYLRGSGLENLVNFPYKLNSNCMDLLSYGNPLFIPQASDSEHAASQIGVPLQIKAQIIGAMIVENRVDGAFFSKDDLSLLTTLSNHAVVAIENAWLYKSVKNNYFSTIQSLVNALEASDKFTKGHSERVRFLSLELGRHIGLDFKELEILEQASILHDIGKIGIESFILQKQGKLTGNEYNMIRTHPLIGEEILAPIENLSEVRKTIIQHHERYDGKGYPYGLRGEELSLKSRILSVVDTFDAMMSDRPYRKAISLQKIKQEVINHSGTQFDPYVVESFIEMLNLREEDLLSSAGYYTFQVMPQG
jgi:HD-GYP domain-containing protein (c-di-GMP phosphodiesterase class II)